MTPSALVLRGLRYYWRTNLAVVIGVATAVAVLSGALLVGNSVRGSLRDLVLQRLGRTDRIVVSTGFFREALADELRRDPDFQAAYAELAPLIVVPGFVSDQTSGRRVSRVQVYGVDDRFWRFHQIGGRSGPDDRGVFLSRALAVEIGAAADSVVLVRVERPSATPIESLHGRKDDIGRTLRLTVRSVIGPSELGDFSIRPQQGPVRAAFVPLRRLQHDLDQADLVNAMLVADRADGASQHREADSSSETLESLLKRHAGLKDEGLAVRALESQDVLAVEGAGGLLDRRRVSAANEAAAATGMRAQPVFTYLANTIRSGDRQVPYSLVTATDLSSIAPQVKAAGRTPPIVINDWTARELAAKVGDPLTLEYFVWEDPGVLRTLAADFTVAAVVPIAGAAADRDLAPAFPGITQADSFSDWDPPFPIDLRRVRPADESYWKQYRTTPKAFIPFDVGQSLWRSRFGDRTSVRILRDSSRESLGEAGGRYTTALISRTDPLAMGFSVHAVRAEGLAASRGATDFGEYFTYFSFFLVASALLLAALFFRLGVEQRAREVGLLRAVGFTTPAVRRLFAGEGLLLAGIGSVLGLAGAVAYGALMMTGLRTWWSGAVGTTALTLHISSASLAAGAAGAVIAAMGCIWWTLRGLARLSERSLLAGRISSDEPAAGPRRRSTATFVAAAVVFGLIGAALIVATMAGRVDRAGAFFGAGASMLIAALCMIAARLRRVRGRSLASARWSRVARLGARNTSDRPGRSVLAIAVIASATFILISVDAFRRSEPAATDRHSGTGGYTLLVDLLFPVAHDPNERTGREALGLTGAENIAVEPFRVLPGDETSCLNLYEPTSPRILGVSQRFTASNRFSFESSLASTDAERANPWLLLNRAPDEAVPVIADANSLTYVLHKKLGDEIVIARGDRPVRLRFVAALADSIFQGEVLMSDANFLTLFPEQQGYRFLLIDAPQDRMTQLGAAIENGAADLGADAVPTTERLAEFHTVENTYLSTFQTLGGLGLLVGTVGLAAVLLRNVLERRRELALLRAVGYRPAHLFTIVLSENVVLLVAGLLVGVISALVAIAPTAVQRGARLPLTATGSWLLLAVLAAGLVSSMIATTAALRGSVVEAIRTE
jgi:putative ABC transport system permease protein